MVLYTISIITHHLWVCPAMCCYLFVVSDCVPHWSKKQFWLECLY